MRTILSRHGFSASTFVLSAFLMAAPAIAQEHTDANGMPTDHSTPAEHAQTENLNNQVSSANAQADAQANSNDAQYQAQQQQYQNQLQQNQAAQQDFQNQSIAYENLRARYAAERAHFRRYEWPERWRVADWRLKNNGSLVNARVQLISGDNVGEVVGVARARDGVIEGLQVREDMTGKVVWIDSADARFDHVNGQIITDLYASDIRAMADERMG